MGKTCSGGREKVPVDGGIALVGEEGFHLPGQGIDKLLPGEAFDGMLPGDHRDRMPGSEREQVGKSDTLPVDDAGPIGKGGGYLFDTTGAERTPLRYIGDCRDLIDTPLDAFGADPAGDTSDRIPAVLEGTLACTDLLMREHAFSVCSMEIQG